MDALDNATMRPVSYTAKNGHLDTIKTFLGTVGNRDYGPDAPPLGLPIIAAAVKGGHVDVIEYLI